MGGRLDTGTFLLGGARALPGACTVGCCAAVVLVCSVGHGGTKRARATAVVLPASALPLGFDAPCLFYTNCFVFCLHFMAFLCIFWN
jgi:hypothetical protein